MKMILVFTEELGVFLRQKVVVGPVIHLRIRQRLHEPTLSHVHLFSDYGRRRVPEVGP